MDLLALQPPVEEVGEEEEFLQAQGRIPLSFQLLALL